MSASPYKEFYNLHFDSFDTITAALKELTANPQFTPIAPDSFSNQFNDLKSYYKDLYSKIDYSYLQSTITATLNSYEKIQFDTITSSMVDDYFRTADWSKAFQAIPSTTADHMNRENAADSHGDIEIPEEVIPTLESALPLLPEEQRAECSEIVSSANNGKVILTFDRVLSLIAVLLTLYSILHGFTIEALQAESSQQTQELLEDIREVEQRRLDVEETRLQTEEAILQAVYALNEKLDAAMDSGDSDCQQQNQDALENTDDLPE